MSSSRTVLSFHIGQCGVQLALPQWELFAKEHNIGLNGYVPKTLEDADFEDDSFETFFYETPSGRKVPRAILVDTDFSVMNYVRSSKYRDLFSRDYLINYKDDCSNNFGMGYLSIGKRIHPKVIEKIRKLSEQSDSIMGFMCYSAIGGGTGSGYGTSLLENLRADLFGDAKLTSLAYQVWPSPELSPSTVEPYNAVLAIKNQLDHLDLVCAFDNEALYDICDRLLPVNVKPTYQTINQLISRVVSGMTCTLRFEGELNVNLSELKTNLVPRPDLHFLMCSTTPVAHQDDQDIMRVYDLTFEAFDDFNTCVRCNPTDGKYLSVCLMYRGDIMPAEVNKATQKLQQQRDIKFAQWVPKGFKIGINYAPLVHGDDWLFNDTCRSLTTVVNNTEIVSVLDRIANSYFQLFKKHAFIHWFTAAGLSMDEFEATTDSFKEMHELYTNIAEKDEAPKP